MRSRIDAGIDDDTTIFSDLDHHMALVGVAGADGIGSTTTIAGTKLDLCLAAPSGSLQNARRQFSKSEREMPCRRAVDEIARGACMLSTTILSFSSSVQRRRRPVSTTPSRSS